MITTEIKHVIGSDSEGPKVIRSIKVIRLLGIVIFKKTYHYPELQHYDVVSI